MAQAVNSEQVRRPVSPGQLEFLQATRKSGDSDINGFPDVRLRDSFDGRSLTPPAGSSLSRTGASIACSSSIIRPSTVEEPYAQWHNNRQNQIRPVDFQPIGSFSVLKETGKLVDSQGGLYPQYKGRERREVSQAQYMPGYTGFVRSGQHISGRTYGETTRRALSMDYREIVCMSPTPSKPQANRKIPQHDLDDSFVSNTFSRAYHVPGYTGFVPGVKHTYAKTYGSATAQELDLHRTIHPRQSTDREGFAKTAIQRKMLTIDSAPLPGGAKTQKPPDMYIPAHLRYLKYFPM